MGKRANAAIEKIRAGAANARKRAAEKKKGLVGRGIAGATGYGLGYMKREGKKLPGADANGQIAGFPAAAAYGVGITAAQIAMPGLAGKLSDWADGAADGLLAVGGYEYALSRPRSGGAAGEESGAVEELPL